MKFSKLLLALVVGTEIFNEVAATGKVNNNKSTKKRYNILNDKGSDIISDIDDDAIVKRIDFDDQDFISVLLTDEQARNVSAKVKQAGGTFENDTVISLPPVTYYPIEDQHRVLATAAVSATPPTTTPDIITGIPKFTGKLRKQTFAIMDSTFYPNSTILKGFKTKVVGNSLGEPCLAHGTNVAEVIAQMFDPTKDDVEFINFPVFDCSGRGYIGPIAAAIDNIIKYKKGPGKNRYITVNFSGTGPANSVIDGLFKKLVDAGIPVVVASGNNGQPCGGYSPTRLALTSVLQSVGGTDGQRKASFSNYAVPDQDCVDIDLPGCVPMTNPVTGVPRIGCGTSFASPEQAGRTAVYQQRYFKTPKQVKPNQITDDMRKNTVTITQEDGITFRAVTPQLAFAWPSRKRPQGRMLSVEEPALRGTAAKPHM